jgi:heme exporter protein A
VTRAITALKLEKVRKVYGRTPVLKGISCAFEPGRPALVVGPNGAGKSTLINILSTLSRPTSGEVRYGEVGHREAERELRGRIGLVAHAPMLYPQMSGRENLLFFARMYRLRRAADEVTRWLERVDMAGAADRPVQQLSRGMVQRIALARALLTDPDLLLMDEPFTGLDRDAAGLLRTEIERACGVGAIVLVVTHDLVAVDGLCAQLLVLRAGRVTADVDEPNLTRASILESYHDPR